MPKSFLADYRPCVGVMLINRQGLVFVGKRLKERNDDGPGQSQPWQMPQGGIDADEDPLAAARRELYEETNVQNTSLIAEAPGWYWYDIPGGMARKEKRWRGQKQRWFALRFEGDDEEIDVVRPAEGRHVSEFSQWQWVKARDLVEMIIPFKRDVYRQVVEIFAPHCAP